jgi:hypothetical protein
METPAINDSFVAFLDLLGFKDRLFGVRSDEDLTRLYADVRTIHRIFEKDSTDPLICDTQAMMKKRIISLSDSLVISYEFGNPFEACASWVDVLAQELADLAVAQGTAVVKGIFMRGGISCGYHFHEDDVLLSDALVRAYQEESSILYPVIALENKIYQRFVADPGQDAYVEEIAPKNDLIKSFIHPGTKKAVHFLDYLEITIQACSSWYSSEDRDRYLAEKNIGTRQEIMTQSHVNSEMRYVRKHAESIRVELAKDHDPKVRSMYEWLREYHNSTIDRLGYPDDAKIQ